jgi:hypothetical protein
MEHARDKLTLYPTSWPRRPDGLLVDDLGVWSRWRTARADSYAVFAFNVRLQTHRPTLNEDTPTARAFLDALARRADVVAFHKADAVDLIEVNTSPGPNALGQLLLYRSLWTKLYTEPVATLRLIAAAVDPELADALHEHGIALDLV